MINFGQFNESFPPIIDGVANVVKNYAYWLNKKYGRCYVITPKHPDATDDYDSIVLRYLSMKVPTRGEYRFGLPMMDPAFWKELKKIPFGLVHAHSPFGSGIAARSIAKKRGIPFVTTFHSKYRDDFKAALKSDIMVDAALAKIISFYESADEVWAVNEASLETLREYGYRGRAFIMENGCDIEMRYRSKKTDDEVNREFALVPEAPLFAYIGQHVWQKNLMVVIEALKILRDRGYRYNMIFVGGGPKKSDMEKMIRAYGLDESVTFTGWIHDRDMIAKIYLRSNALLFPSMYDTSSLIPREAAACGCPTVFVKGASTAQGITEEDGFLVENNRESLADVAAYIINNPQKASIVGENARNTIYRSWENAVDMAYERYLHLIAIKKQAPIKQAK